MTLSDISAVLSTNASVADYLLALIAAAALWFAYKTARATSRTTELQSRPFLSMTLIKNQSAANIMKAINGEKIDPWFILQNSGASPCIVRQINREWSIYNQHRLNEQTLVQSINPVPNKECFIAIGAGQKSATIRTQLILSANKGFVEIPDDYWDKKQLLHFILTVVFCSADERAWYEAKFTYILGPTHLELAFPRDNVAAFSYQKPIKRPTK